MSGRAPSSNGDTFSESSAVSLGYFVSSRHLISLLQLMWTSSSSSHRPTHCNLPQPGSFPYSPGTSLSTPTTQHSCLVLYPMPPLSFDSLPLNSNDPPLSAWGLWGHGKEKWLGSLNLLTGERVKEAAKGIITGQRISLNVSLYLAEHAMHATHPRTRAGSNGLYPTHSLWSRACKA